MHIWQPEPEEMLLARAPVTFATGTATRVRGMRWFRDTDRNDIQHDLPGWPEGPTYTARSTGGTVARNSVKGAVIAAGVIVMGILSSQGGSVGPSSSEKGSDTPDDRANEVEDFPVLWAAPGSIARHLPWQLDPGRSSEKHHKTHAIVTDRRLVFVRLPFDKKSRKHIDDEILWECPRSAISGIEMRDFKDGNDFKVTFTDNSWCRLSSIRRRRLTRYLDPHLDLLSFDSLTPPQRATVDSFITEIQMPGHPSPIITRNSCGHYRVEILPPSRLDSFFGASEENIIMDSGGQQIEVTEYHPEDF